MENSTEFVPTDKNPLINGTSLLDIEETIDKATDVLQYLSDVHQDDRKYHISDHARMWIENCAIDALRYAQHQIGLIRADKTGSRKIQNLK